jgi:hypothetical protein
MIGENQTRVLEEEEKRKEEKVMLCSLCKGDCPSYNI